MKAYGSVRTYAKCRVGNVAGDGAPRKIKVFVKNHKADRTAKINALHN